MNRSLVKNFWKWFSTAEQALRGTVSPDSPMLKELAAAIRAVDPDLTYELTHRTDSSELIISANGVRELIPIVESLVNAKPKLPDWKITALRQRRPLPGASIQCGDVSLSTDQVEFSLSLELRRVDITLYLDTCSNDEYYRWLETVFLLLDAAIGERDVAMHVGEVFIKEKDSDTSVETYPFTELPSHFDEFLAASRADLVALNAMDTNARRALLTERVTHNAVALAEQLLDESKELEWDKEMPPMVTIELHYRQDNELTAAGLVSMLEHQRNAVAEQIDFGGVTTAVHWVHAWFDIPLTELPHVGALIEALATEAHQYNCELESAFLSWAEETASIANILGSLDTLADAHIVLEAHQELDHGNAARAVELLEEALEEDAENLEVRALLAYAYAKLRDNEMAEACLDELKDDVGSSGEHPTLFWNIACAYALLAEAQHACEHLRLAFALDPELRELAIKDPDLSSLKGQPEFDELMFQA